MPPNPPSPSNQLIRRGSPTIPLLAAALMLCSLAVAPANSQASNQQEPITLQLIPIGDLWWSGSRHIPLKCTITNRSEASITCIPPDQIGDGLTWEIKDSKGQLFRRTSGVTSCWMKTGPDTYMTLPDGASYTFGLNQLIGQSYQYRPQGSYTIWMKFTIPGSPTSEKMEAEDTCTLTSANIKDHLVSKPLALIPVVIKEDWRALSRSRGFCAIAERIKGDFWLAYWEEVLDDPPAVNPFADGPTGTPSPTPLARERKYSASELYWLGPVSKGAAFTAVVSPEDAVHVTFQDPDGLTRRAVIPYLYEAPEVSADIPPGSSFPITAPRAAEIALSLATEQIPFRLGAENAVFDTVEATMMAPSTYWIDRDWEQDTTTMHAVWKCSVSIIGSSADMWVDAHTGNVIGGGLHDPGYRADFPDLPPKSPLLQHINRIQIDRRSPELGWSPVSTLSINRQSDAAVLDTLAGSEPVRVPLLNVIAPVRLTVLQGDGHSSTLFYLPEQGLVGRPGQWCKAPETFKDFIRERLPGLEKGGSVP